MHAILVKIGLNWPKFGQKGDQNYICMDKILNEDEGKRKKTLRKKGKIRETRAGTNNGSENHTILYYVYTISICLLRTLESYQVRYDI